jgi:hypothetical protein
MEPNMAFVVTRTVGELPQAAVGVAMTTAAAMATSEETMSPRRSRLLLSIVALRRRIPGRGTAPEPPVFNQERITSWEFG